MRCDAPLVLRECDRGEKLGYAVLLRSGRRISFFDAMILCLLSGELYWKECEVGAVVIYRGAM